MTTPRLGIVELRAVCRSMRHWNTQLFEELGPWVLATDEPALQQFLAEACHRHAWHAELWDARTPAIPIGEPDIAPRPALDDSDRLASYRASLTELSATLDALTERIDRRLDPSTCRAIDLVSADLAALDALVSAIG